MEKEKIRIAYSCAGEGFGHAARLVSLAPKLEERYEMHYFIPPSVKPFIAEKLNSFTFYPLPHFSFVKKEDRVQWLQTAEKTIPRLLNFEKEVHRLTNLLKRLRIQAVLNDYDPYLAWAGKKAGIPVLQVNHPGIIARKFPLHPMGWIPGLVSLFLEGPWTERVHVSFFHGDVGPLFRSSLFQYPIRDEGYLLVNVKASYREPVLRVLKDIQGISYRVFPSKNDNFEDALAGCRAIISSAGHQIISEALVLGKPILVIPQKGQWEQQLNAKMLYRTKRGAFTSISRLKKDLILFLKHMGEYGKVNCLPKGFTLEDGTESLLQRIDAFLSTHASNANCSFHRCFHHIHSLRAYSPRLNRLKGVKWAPIFPPPSQSVQ